MVDYQQYLWLSVIGPTFFTLLTIIATIGFFCKKCRGLEEGYQPLVSAFVGNFITGFSITKEPGSDNYVYIIYGKKICYEVIDYISPATMSLLLISMGIFTSAFVIQERITTTCSETYYDCFLLSSIETTTVFSTEPLNPITNCSQYTEHSTLFVCFHYVFNYTVGLSRAGGFVFATKTIFNVSLILLIYATRSNSLLVKWGLYVTVYAVQVIFILFPVTSLALPDVVGDPKRIGEIVQFYSYELGMIIVLITTSVTFYWLEVRHCGEEDAVVAKAHSHRTTLAK